MNYVELRAAIQEYSEDFEASFVDNIDNFIRLTESRIMLRVRLPNYRKDATGALTLGNDRVLLPSDFLAADYIRVRGTTTPVRVQILLSKDPEFIRECYPDGGSDIPRFYTVLNENTLLVGPVPDADYDMDLGYFFEPPSIVIAGTTWLGDHFAHALVSGSLMEACVYMKSEDNLYQRYTAQFERDLAMDEQYAKGRTKKDTYREPDLKVKV